MEPYEQPEANVKVGSVLTLTGYLVMTITVMLVGIAAAAIIGNAQMGIHAKSLHDAIESNNEAIRSLEMRLSDTASSHRTLRKKVEQLENTE